MAGGAPREIPLDRISIYKNNLSYIERIAPVTSLKDSFTLHVPNASAAMVMNTFSTAVEGGNHRYICKSNWICIFNILFLSTSCIEP